MGRQRILCVAVVVAAFVAATPAMAPRLGLAERVTKLENEANAAKSGAGQANLEAQNRIVELQSEVGALRNQVETLLNEIEQLKQSSRDQYVDLDSRLGRLEGNPSAAPPVAAGAAPASPARPEPAPAAREPAPRDTASAAAAPAAPIDPAAEEGSQPLLEVEQSKT